MVELFVECCGAVEDVPPPPVIAEPPQIAPTILAKDITGRAPMSFAELLAARARAQGATAPVVTVPNPANPKPAGTASDADADHAAIYDSNYGEV